jgi:hypothetical protein
LCCQRPANRGFSSGAKTGQDNILHVSIHINIVSIKETGQALQGESGKWFFFLFFLTSSSYC